MPAKSKTRSKGLIIIPAYNEERNISKVLDGLSLKLPELAVLVVNDGSTDATAKILGERSANHINLPFNMGYGAALQTGFKYALNEGFDFVVCFDGDGQHEPTEVPKLLKEMEELKADIVIGSRFLNRSDYTPSLARRAGMALFRFLTGITTGSKMTDITSGFQAIDRKAFSYYAKEFNFPLDFPDADVIINMILTGHKVVEVPVKMHERTEGESMHSGLRAVFYMAKMLLAIFIVVMRNKFGTNGERALTN